MYKPRQTCLFPAAQVGERSGCTLAAHLPLTFCTRRCCKGWIKAAAADVSAVASIAEYEVRVERKSRKRFSYEIISGNRFLAFDALFRHDHGLRCIATHVLFSGFFRVILSATMALL